MSTSTVDSGIGVNLVWTRYNLTDQTLTYRNAGVLNQIAVISGRRNIQVLADMDTYTYSVTIDDIERATGIPFNSPKNINTVRFMTHLLSENNFSGRCFDNLVLTSNP